MTADDPTLSAVAARHGFAEDAATAALNALRRGLGGMAQFDHPGLGGRGQRMGGMVLIGRDDPDLKARVAALFADLDALNTTPRSEMEPMKPMRPMKPMEPMKPMAGVDVDAPADWGQPSSSGSQNDIKYAFFPGARRLVVVRGGDRSVYDTADHRITGVAQDQSDTTAGRVAFTSDRGTVSLDSLKKI